ncbi:TadE/TadG family type IV pilus assembly protein [Sphingopyxis macrogoltabida]|uniref:Transporter n=1 Tax=Sphingopyxis macrogoltabida TaxID=33050 RepID=A0AAC9AV44_SPHMC|nr:TadE/TadG family type IV pilus assembly protein [Sphingopyxis macrogoltabida]ALJ13057.1 transporter [Sphingopyxis macrogoltabida]AMU89477.1 transporter [Sphingopyxis macrogoltabida]
MTDPLFLSRLTRPFVEVRQALVRHERGAAMIEMALVLPLFLALLMGILVYGQYFLLAHSVQQAANDGARAAIVGLDAADRRAIATRAVDRSLQGAPQITPDKRTIAVSETGDAITVGVTYTVPADSFLRTSIVPVPGNVIRADATFELPVE